MSFRVKIWKFLFIVLCRKSWKLLKGLKIPFLKSSIFGEGEGGGGGGGGDILDFFKGGSPGI